LKHGGEVLEFEAFRYDGKRAPLLVGTSLPNATLPGQFLFGRVG
jgi:hypothetical protein